MSVRPRPLPVRRFARCVSTLSIVDRFRRSRARFDRLDVCRRHHVPKNQPTATPPTQSVKEFFQRVIDSAISFFIPKTLRGPEKIFSSPFFPVYRCRRTLKLLLDLLPYRLLVCYRFYRNRNSSSGVGTVAILKLWTPITFEPSESERSYWTSACTYYAPIRRSNLPVVSTSGLEIFGVKVFPPKF